VYAVVFSFFVVSLTSYHHYLIIVNNTTNENLKNTYRELGNPFR